MSAGERGGKYITQTTGLTGGQVSFELSVAYARA